MPQQIVHWSPSGEILLKWEAPHTATEEWLQGEIARSWDRRTSWVEIKRDGRYITAVFRRTKQGGIVKVADENGDLEMSDELEQVENEDQENEGQESKPQKKWERVLELLSSDEGATIGEIAGDLDINLSAARSYIGDLRNRGFEVVRTRNEDKVSVYKVAE